MAREIRLPDIGDFKDVPIIEIHVKPGQSVAKEEVLLTLESDKATLDVPAPEAGVIGEIKVKVGDKVSQGDAAGDLCAGGAARAPAPTAPPRAAEAPPRRPPPRPRRAGGKADLECDVLVLGAGPGGYTAAFRAADLGQKVVLVDRRATLGGVCLNVGCIPSKALLHVAKVIDEAAHMSARMASTFGAPSFDLDKLRGWKDGVVKRLTGGLTALARQRKVTVVTGEAKFTSRQHDRGRDGGGRRARRALHQGDHRRRLRAGRAGLHPERPAHLGFDRRARAALHSQAHAGARRRHHRAGDGDRLSRRWASKITVIEMMDQLMPGADRDIVAPFAKRVEKRYEKIMLEDQGDEGRGAAPTALHVALRGRRRRRRRRFRRDAGLGRPPARTARRSAPRRRASMVDERGFIAVDKQMRTNVAISSPSATSSASRCSPTRRRTRARSRRKSPAATSRPSTPR